MEIRHYNIWVKGRVQGVWFRKYTKVKADELGIKGFVRNEPDHHVYIEAEAGEDQLNELIQWLYQGSPLSRVTHVKFEIGSLSDFNNFKISH